MVEGRGIKPFMGAWRPKRFPTGNIRDPNTREKETATNNTTEEEVEVETTPLAAIDEDEDEDGMATNVANIWCT